MKKCRVYLSLLRAALPPPHRPRETEDVAEYKFQLYRALPPLAQVLSKASKLLRDYESAASKRRLGFLQKPLRLPFILWHPRIFQKLQASRLRIRDDIYV